MSGDTWSDGEPVIPWADPWHDIAGDIRDVMDSYLPTGNPLLDAEVGKIRAFWRPRHEEDE